MCIVSGRQRPEESEPDTPPIEFTYEDRDTYFNELSELYSYSEMPEFQTTMDLFHASLESVCGLQDWNKASLAQKKNFILVMLERFEVSDLVSVYDSSIVNSSTDSLCSCTDESVRPCTLFVWTFCLV